MTAPSLNKLANLQTLAKNQSTPAAVPANTEGKRAFRGPFHGYASFLTAKGNPFTFYQGYLVTDDAEVIAEAAAIKGVQEVEYSDNVPTPPERTRGRARNVPIHEATVISPLELLTRAVGNTTHVPQSAESSSTTAN